MSDADRQPFLVGWGITDRCNLSCAHCYSSAVKIDRGELTTGECLRLIDSLALLGAQRIGWTGGEPLLRKDLETLIARALSCGIESGITTNGIPLSPRRAASLKEAGTKAIQISLDGSTPERNRLIRGAEEREFGRILDGVAAARDCGLTVHLAMLVAAATIDDVRPFIELARSMGIRSVRLCGFVPWGYAQDDSIRRRFDLSDRLGELRDLVEELQHLESPVVLFDPAFGPLPPAYDYHECQAGTKMLYISGNGSVYPCTSLLHDRFCIGNVKERSLEDLWNDPAMSSVATMPRDHITGACADCDHFARCRGACRGIAHACSGDLNAPFPNCLAQFSPAIVSSDSIRSGRN